MQPSARNSTVQAPPVTSAQAVPPGKTATNWGSERRYKLQMSLEVPHLFQAPAVPVLQPGEEAGEAEEVYAALTPPTPSPPPPSAAPVPDPDP